MCQHQEEVTEGQILQRYEVPGRPLKRAEYHTQLCGLVWKRTGMTHAIGAAEDLGVGFRVPKGEIWSLLYGRFSCTLSAVTNWSDIRPSLLFKLPYQLNGLYDGSAESRELIIGAVKSQSSATSFNFGWCRQGISENIYWHEWCERQRVLWSARSSAAGTWTTYELGLIYYRVRLYDKLLDDLRKAEGDDCEVQKLLAAAFPWVNDRNDSDW